jgi:hypothetical protein
MPRLPRKVKGTRFAVMGYGGLWRFRSPLTRVSVWSILRRMFYQGDAGHTGLHDRGDRVLFACRLPLQVLK